MLMYRVSGLSTVSHSKALRVLELVLLPFRCLLLAVCYSDLLKVDVPKEVVSALSRGQVECCMTYAA